ncbi:acyl-CoA desaturase [Massilia pinisoli]|uniref:Acyl-CoA desaturase n=1 Tax=Massilia pinisoli TaxID=1772194 RepID=A0ABT1ZU15_9BURK|nr:acyl-CoA desaturase [Massilia pinisoli]MCS0583436.1 acyl-CoA desaturase [Massilia pinisoli]
MHHTYRGNVAVGNVRWSPAKSLWWTAMVCASVVGGWLTFSWVALTLFLAATATVLLFGHSLGSHRKLIHDSFGCPKWLEYALVYAGVQVGLAGPLGLLAQHNLRDYAQRQPDCHDYLRHGRSFWRDGWWQLHCDLALADPPVLPVPPTIADDKFYRFLERTWMLQQIPPALVLYALGGWAFVIWGVCARIATGVTGHWLVGYFAHNHGGMHHTVDGAAVQGRNVTAASLLTMGESWHNNHHAWPGSAKLGLYPGEWDPGWWVLVLLERAGWAWRLKLPADCPTRPSCATTGTAIPSPYPDRACPYCPRCGRRSRRASGCWRGAGTSCCRGRASDCRNNRCGAWPVRPCTSCARPRRRGWSCATTATATTYAACPPC